MAPAEIAAINEKLDALAAQFTQLLTRAEAWDRAIIGNGRAPLETRLDRLEQRAAAADKLAGEIRAAVFRSGAVILVGAIATGLWIWRTVHHNEITIYDHIRTDTTAQTTKDQPQP